jgi:hypothetical protein
MLRGHRQLLVAKADGRVLIEKMLDGWTGPVTIALEPPEPSPVGARRSLIVMLFLCLTSLFAAAAIRRLTTHAG